jgi:hypothetical protein
VPTRDSLTGRVAATLEHPLHVATETVADLAHRSGAAIADLGQRADATGISASDGEGRLGGPVRGGRAARRQAARHAEAARKEARRQMAKARKEAGRRRKRFFKRRRRVQALAVERVDSLKASATAAGSAATAAAASRASDAADLAAERARQLAGSGAEQARTLAGEARSWLAEQAAGIDVAGAMAALAPPVLSKPSRKRRRPLTTIVIGAAAGLVGMAAMEAAQRGVALAGPQESGGEGAEGEAVADPWQDAPSPAKVGRRIWEGVLHQPKLGPDKIGFATNVVHVGYGITLAAVFALIEESREHPNPLLDGALFGLAAWALEEYLLPRVDVSPPAKSFSLTEHAEDLAVHLAYGLGAGATIAAADARR